MQNRLREKRRIPAARKVIIWSTSSSSENTPEFIATVRISSSHTESFLGFCLLDSIEEWQKDRIRSADRFILSFRRSLFYVYQQSSNSEWITKKGICSSRQSLYKPLRHQEAKHSEYLSCATWCEDTAIRSTDGVVRVLNRVEALSKASSANDIKRSPTCPLVHLDTDAVASIRFRGQNSSHQCSRLVPKHRVQVLNMPIGKSRHKMLPLHLIHCQCLR